MASRESQGLQVALILFVMITVVLAVTTYVYFRKSEELARRVETAENEKTTATNATMTLDFENQLLKHYVGYAPKSDNDVKSLKQSLTGNADIEAIAQAFDQDMATYGAGLEANKLNYRNLPENLITTIRVRNEHLGDSTKRESLLEKERDKIRDDGEARVQAAQAALDTAVKDYTAAKNTYSQETMRTAQEKQAIGQQLAAKLKEIQAMAATSQAEISKRDTQLTNMENLYESAMVKIEAQRETSFERPDGEVTWVNQRSGVVWIDLGSADGLERQVTFSVYDKGANGVNNAPVKARLEVTKIIDDHVAECRILEDDLRNPIMDHDIIYSPSFRKGQKTRFALAGLLDINGDGKSDQEKVKSIITQGGGLIDAELLPNGEIVGKMTHETRYLIKGERPTDKTNQKLTQGYTTMIDEATKLGIESQSLTTLLDRMGYRAEQRVVPLNRGGTGGVGENSSDQFRRRAPSSAY